MLLEQLTAVLRLAFQGEGSLVLREHLGPLGRQIVGEQLLGPVFDGRIGVVHQLPGAQGIELARLEPLGVDLIEEDIDARGLAQHRFEDFAADAGSCAGPELHQQGGDFLVLLGGQGAKGGDAELGVGLVFGERQEPRPLGLSAMVRGSRSRKLTMRTSRDRLPLEAHWPASPITSFTRSR